jgi:hypothetical protein
VTHRLAPLAAAAFLLLLDSPARATAPACPEGQVESRGACAPACPTGDRFGEPAGCECPAGYGKILLGDGGGTCLRRACVSGKVVDAGSCDCPEGLDRRPAGKGKIQCVAPKAAAKPAAKPGK